MRYPWDPSCQTSLSQSATRSATVGFVLVVCYRTEVVQLEKHLAQPKKHPNWSLLIPKFYQTQKTCMFQLEWCFQIFTSEKWLELTISNHFCSGGRFFLPSCCEEKYFDHDFEYRHVILPKESPLWFAVLPFGLWIPNHILYMYMIHTHIIISSYHQYINIFSYHICIYVPYIYIFICTNMYIYAVHILLMATRNPAKKPPDMYETLQTMGHLAYQLVSLPDFWTTSSSCFFRSLFPPGSGSQSRPVEPCWRATSWGFPVFWMCFFSMGNLSGVITPWKINMEPENTPVEKENHLPIHHFQVLC